MSTDEYVPSEDDVRIEYVLARQGLEAQLDAGPTSAARWKDEGMRRAPETIDPFDYTPEPGDAFAGGIIDAMTLRPDKRIREVTIDLTDGSFLTYEGGPGGTWVLRDATLIAAPTIRALESVPPPSA